jgi:hypothetical protein
MHIRIDSRKMPPSKSAFFKVVPFIHFPPFYKNYQIAEKQPSAAFPLSFVVAEYRQVHLTPPVVGSYRQDFGSLASGPF